MTHVPLDPAVNTDLMAVNPRFFQDENLKKLDFQTAMSMGLTAEKLHTESGITRREMDEWSMESHLRAAKAVDDGYFADEILPVEVEQEDGSMLLVENDLSIRPNTTLDKLAELKPAFKPDGQITAGNSSPLNAGAVALLLMSEDKAKSMGLKPLAKIISMGWAGVEPSVMGKGPVPASRKALEKAGMSIEDIEYWEINEAFAVVTLYGIRELGLDPEKVNLRGGAIAIGHPLACSGPRLTGTLARILKENDAKYGMATLCGGGGQGGATIIEAM
jgi:acetyl-CoA acetyltransferase family protein